MALDQTLAFKARGNDRRKEMLTVTFDFEMLAGEARCDVVLDLFGSRQHGMLLVSGAACSRTRAYASPARPAPQRNRRLSRGSRADRYPTSRRSRSESRRSCRKKDSAATLR